VSFYFAATSPPQRATRRQAVVSPPHTNPFRTLDSASETASLRSSVWEAVPVELDDLLSAMDRTAANLAKLEDVWNRAESFIPNRTGTRIGTGV
jgi:hypothetical protein